MARAPKAATRIVETLARNRRDALSLIQTKGKKATRTMLEEAARDLEKRLRQAPGLAGKGETFTVTQMRATLAQVRAVLQDVTKELGHVVVEHGETAAENASDHTVSYLVDADQAYRGVGSQPLAIKEAAMLDRATTGVRSSLLRRLGMSGEEEAEDVEEARYEHPAKMRVLQRYGVEGISTIEKSLQRGLVAKKSWAEMRDDLIEESPFLQGQPAYWAERIVRTEVHGAYNRAGWEAIRAADEELGDMVKILSATFDDRTAWDSYQVHGQVRRPNEPFEWAEGAYMHPPNRPNDREVVTPHRIVWPIPPILAWASDEMVVSAWLRDGRKGAPPERPLMTTVDLSLFGRS